MGKLFTIGEVKQLDSGDLVSSIQGKIKTVFERKEGTNDNGEWSLQGFILEDEDDEIRVVLKKRDELPKSAKGRTVRLTCHISDKGKSGVYAKEDDYKGVVKMQIEVTPSAEFEYIDEEGNAEEVRGGKYEAKKTAKAPAKKEAAPEDRKSAEIEAVKKARLVAARTSVATQIALDSAVATKVAFELKHKPTQMSDAQFQNVTTCAFMQILDSGLLPSFPVTMIEIPKKEEKKGPTEEELREQEEREEKKRLAEEERKKREEEEDSEIPF